MLNNPLPSPLNMDADTEPVTLSEPVNVEPLSGEITTNPKSGDTDAVTEPDANAVDVNASGANAVLGISNNPAPLPLNILPLLKKTLPLNVEPLSSDTTKNPNSSLTEAVTLPLAILAILNDNADSGILNKFSPLPLKLFASISLLTSKEPVIVVSPISIIGEVGIESYILNIPVRVDSYSLL